MKKILLILTTLFVFTIIGGMILMAFKDDQIKLQYTDEVISDYKRSLDFTPFEEGFKTLTDERLKTLETLIFEQDLEALQKAILNKEMTCEEVTLYHLYRIKEYQDYNIMIELNPKALLQAKALDEKITSGGELGKLFASTVLLKDNVAALDMYVAAGTYALKDTTSNRDAFLVTQLKDQDAIVLGKANLSEWSNFMSDPSSNGFSVLGGQTKNPYGQFDVGGSSSGPSAGVSMNLSTFSIGSETCGSLIYPAGQNSIVTLKPTIGLISRDLIVPITEAQDTAGVMSRNVKDLNTVFSTLVVEDKKDPRSQAVKDIAIDTTLDLKYLEGKVFGVADSESDQMKKIIKEFEKNGAKVIPVSFSEEASNIDMLTVLLYGIKVDVNAFLNNPDINSDFKSLEAIVDYYKNHPEFMPYGQTYLKQGQDLTLTKEEYETLITNNEKLTKEALDTVLEDNNLSGILSISNELAVLYSAAGYPAVSIPAGYEESGEPYNLTIVGGYTEDFNLIKAAYAYEQATKHRKVPTLNH